MMVYINKKAKYGKTRSEIEDNLRKDGLSSLSDEQYDKCKYGEKILKKQLGSKSNFLNQRVLKFID